MSKSDLADIELGHELAEAEHERQALAAEGITSFYPVGNAPASFHEAWTR